MTFISNTVNSIKIVLQGFLILCKITGDIVQAISLTALIAQGWFMPYYFRDQLHWSIIFAGYFAAGVITVLAFSLFVKHLKYMGERQLRFGGITPTPGVINRAL